MTPVLEFDHVSIDIHTGAGHLRVIDDVSLSIGPGEIIGLVGESGSGKSTMVMAALGLLPAGAVMSGGRILFDGKDTGQSQPGQSRSVIRTGQRPFGLVGQNPMRALNPVLTIGTQLVDVQHRNRTATRKEKLERAEASLARVGIPEPRARLAAYPHELSGGTLQRVAIAAALLIEPRLLLADEPTTALDVTTEVQIMRLLLEARDRYGLSVLLVTHHLGLITGMCDRVAVLYAGRMAEAGPVSDVFERPAHPYAAALLACDPAYSNWAELKRLPVIPGRPPALQERGNRCEFAPRCARARDICSSQAPHTTVPTPRREVSCHFPLLTPVSHHQEGNSAP
jgi:oligopeptide/dipeptide ABC transporter ATP-binding protein